VAVVVVFIRVEHQEVAVLEVVAVLDITLTVLTALLILAVAAVALDLVQYLQTQAVMVALA
jgi:hypothetical protein